MAFYCNAIKDVCACNILCADCKAFDGSGGVELPDNVAVQKWISVNEKLPLDNQELGDVVQVLVSDVWGDISTALYMGNRFFPEFPVYEGDVTHWMPLPKPPKEE